MQTQVEELADNRVRLEIEVPSEDVKHAVEHAASDLAESLRIPGFRKGKVPRQVLLARVGRERVFSEAVESHIGGWFWNAAARSRIRPVEQPQYGYELPSSDQESFHFTATVAVQPKPDVPGWSELEVPFGDVDVPEDLIDQALDGLRASVAELVPVDGRPAREGDTLVVDLVTSSGETHRDYVVELGSGRLVEEIERGLLGMSAGDTRQLEHALPDGTPARVEATVKEIKEKVLPPLDDDFARTASEFETLGELRADVEQRLRAQLEEEAEASFRQAVVDRLVEASSVEASGPLVDARAAELWNGFTRSLERRGVSPETYLQLTGESPDQLRERLLAEARQSVSRELVLEAVADRLGLEVSDDELKAFIREEAELAGDDPDETIARVWESSARERLRADLRLRTALDRVVSEVRRVPVELARAREKLWTPGQEKSPADTKLWTPGSKENA